MKAIKERIWLEENSEMLEKSPKEYFKCIFEEMVEEIKHNERYLKNDEFLFC